MDSHRRCRGANSKWPADHAGRTAEEVCSGTESVGMKKKTLSEAPARPSAPAQHGALRIITHYHKDHARRRRLGAAAGGNEPPCGSGDRSRRHPRPTARCSSYTFPTPSAPACSSTSAGFADVDSRKTRSSSPKTAPMPKGSAEPIGSTEAPGPEAMAPPPARMPHQARAAFDGEDQCGRDSVRVPVLDHQLIAVFTRRRCRRR